MLGVFAEF
jgi:hypothetical protein